MWITSEDIQQEVIYAKKDVQRLWPGRWKYVGFRLHIIGERFSLSVRFEQNGIEEIYSIAI